MDTTSNAFSLIEILVSIISFDVEEVLWRDAAPQWAVLENCGRPGNGLKKDLEALDIKSLRFHFDIIHLIQKASKKTHVEQEIKNIDSHFGIP